MSMRRRCPEHRQEFWMAAANLASTPGHPFYRRLNPLLAEAGFDTFVEQRGGRRPAAPSAGGVFPDAAERRC